MKLVCFLLLLTTACHGQSAMGNIGRFQIGKTPPTILYTLLNESSDSLHKVTSFRQVQPGDLTVYELLSDKKLLADFDPYGTYCPVAKILLLNHYLIDTIPLTNLVLSFYDNVLISFQCEYSTALEQALGEKYGQPVTSSHSDKSACDGQLDVVYTQDWKKDGLRATLTYQVAHDASCSKRTTGQFRLWDTELVEQLTACSDSKQLELLKQTKFK